MTLFSKLQQQALVLVSLLLGNDFVPSWPCCDIRHPCENMGAGFEQLLRLCSHQVMYGGEVVKISQSEAFTCSTTAASVVILNIGFIASS